VGDEGYKNRSMLNKKTNNKATVIFEDKPVRRVWRDKEEKWYFSIVDIVQVLTDSINPTDYLKKLRKRDEELAKYIGTNCPYVEMFTETGKKRLITPTPGVGEL